MQVFAFFYSRTHKSINTGHIWRSLIATINACRTRYDPEKWCSCIDGALTKKYYLDSIRKAGFKNVEVLEEKAYIDDQADNDDIQISRKISSLIIKAVKG